jgi:hypothetical protein
MFEAYKVGVTLALHNQVSSVLGLIARDFAKTNVHAIALKTTLKEVKLLGMAGAIVGGAGFLGLGIISRTIAPAKEYVHQLQLAQAAGMSQLEIANATGAAWKTTGEVMTTTAADNLKVIKELRQVFGGTEHAITFLPQMQKMQAVLDNVLHGHGGIGAKDVGFTAARMLELRGVSMNTESFGAQSDLIMKAVIASGGKVTPQMLLQAQKYGGIGATSFGNDFMYGVLPTIVQELGGSSTGTSLTSMYRAVVGGRMDKRSLKKWEKLGLADISHADIGKDTAMIRPGDIAGADLFKTNPYRYVQDVLIPALVKHGITSTADQSAEMDRLFSNRNAGRIANIFATQGPRIEKDFNLIGKAGTTGAYNDLIKNDPMMAAAALSAQWENLKTSIGVAVVPILLPVMRGLTTAFNTLGQFLMKHPTITSALTLTFTALSGLAAIGGTLMIAGAGLKLLGVGITPFSIALRGMGALPLVGIASGLTAIGLSLAALLPAIYHKEIADAVDDTSWGRWIGDKLNNLTTSTGSLNGYTGARGQNGRSYAPPSSAKPVQVSTQVNLDGREIANVVTQHQVNTMNGPSTSGSGFDSRQSYVPVGVTGAW